MAKISARGATKVAEVRAEMPNGTYQVVFVMCSDGRILRRFTGDTTGSGYGVSTRVGKARATKATLQAYVSRLGYKEV
jgi:hypothetical protein